MVNVEGFPDVTELSAEQRELLTYLLEEEGIELPQVQEITRREKPGEVPLSFAQERVWFLEQLEPGNIAYNIPAAYRLKGPLNVAALEQSLNEIVRRHEALRTIFPAVDGHPTQVIVPVVTLTLPIVDLQGGSEARQEVEVQRLAVQEAQQPFDLAQGPLLRATLLRLGEEDHVLFLTMHHAISDEWSIGVFNRELAPPYEAFSAGKPSPLPELPIQYADFAHWQRQWLQGEVLETQLVYWKQQLGGGLPVLKLPTDRPRPAVQTLRGAVQSFVLPTALSEALKALNHQGNVTPFMTLLAVFKTLLYRYTGQEDIIVGSPIANRNRTEVEGLIGFFINTLVLRTDLSGNPTFRELLSQVREVTLEAHAHQDLPFEKLVDELQPERDQSHNPLFQVMFVLRNALMEPLTLPDLTVSPLEFDSGTAKFDLTLFMEETEQCLRGFFEYNTDLFDAATMARMAEHFQVLLDGIVANPEQRISDLPLLTEAERHQLLVEWNDTETECPQDECVHERFEAQVEQMPEAVAVVFEEEQLSYQELNRRANQLARFLQKLGVGPEVSVGICVERSLEMVVGLLSILKAGGAYVPLDPAYPRERLAFMLEDAQVPVLLTQERLVEGLPEHRARVVCLDADWEAIAKESEENLDCDVAAGNLAYVIYTSGSTGRPKGVAIAHQSTTALLHWAKEIFCAESLAGILASTSICFDLSVFELFVPLSRGGKVVLAENALQLPNLSMAGDITLVNTVPSAITELLRMDGGLPGSVRTVNLAGEVLRTEVVQRIYQQDTIQRVFDLYGPSEDTTYSTFALRSASGPYTIGRPIANTQIYLLDASLQPVPVGVPGELYIAGAGLARGYLNWPELTAESFIPNPFSDGSGVRLYKTGDLARYLPDGNIEFLGRIDHQVKIRGFRIELGEIEAVLGQHPDVRETVVLAREDQPGNKRLVAYVVPAQEPIPTISELRRFLKGKLPEYMVPSAFVMLDALPLTPSGKVNRRALSAPDAGRPELEEAFVAPHTLVEKLLADIWAQVIGLERVGIRDNFFELGGDSLLAIQIVARANQRGLHFSVRRFFQHPTIAELTAVADTTSLVQAEQDLVTGPVPITPSQYFFLELSQQHSDDLNYRTVVPVFEARQALEPSLLETATNQLLVHHDMLRARFERLNSGWRQVIVEPDATVPFTCLDLSALPESGQAHAVRAATTELRMSLNLAMGPLLRVALFDLGPNKPNRLMIIVHHLVCDAVSLGVLLEDLETAYQQLGRGEVIQFPPKTTSFKYWSRRLTEYAQLEALQQEMGYWLAEPEKWTSHLPMDYPEGANTVKSTRFIPAWLSVEETQTLLQEIPKVYSAQLIDVLLMALMQVFAWWTGKRYLPLFLTAHGREDISEDVDVSRTVGHFALEVPVLLDVGKVSDPKDMAKVIQEQLRRVPGRGLGYGLLRYLSGNAELAEKLQAIRPQVRFHYSGIGIDGSVDNSSLFRLGQGVGWPKRGGGGTRDVLLGVGGALTRGRLYFLWGYSRNVYRRSTIESLAQDLVKTLSEILST